MPRSIVRLTAFCTLLAGCASSGKMLYVSQTSASLNPPDAIFACTRANLDTLGYRPVSLNLIERRVTGRKVRPDVQPPEPTFYQAYDEIESQVVAGGASGETALNLEGHTLYEYRTSAGPWVSERHASDSVQTDLAQLTQKCGGVK